MSLLALESLFTQQFIMKNEKLISLTYIFSHLIHVRRLQLIL